MLDFKSAPKHKSGRGPSSEHFWQVWLKSVQRFQRRRFKCEKLTDGRRTLTHDKSSHGLWPGELKMSSMIIVSTQNFYFPLSPPPPSFSVLFYVCNCYWYASINVHALFLMYMCYIYYVIPRRRLHKFSVGKTCVLSFLSLWANKIVINYTMVTSIEVIDSMLVREYYRESVGSLMGQEVQNMMSV